ncbi:hypothetical protein [Serpentinicella alkaliphila]|uniref:hypothetical protein n=1 Tax=Serpentinicella alkaliphila TaxID=1734049 RepID=UPI00140483E5|nr:hypothetical protein [Serpentinicella alkaliphila]QUH26564.1 hypothetical protein HZR23_13105 [Serpentinicella alkaliphila]
MMYITSPEALDLELIQKNQEYLVNGRWIKKFERYSYGKDFIAIHLPEGTIISSSSLKNFEIIKEEDTYLSEDLNAVIKKNPNYDSSKNITLFMIDLSREFQFTFELNNFLSKNDVTIQYVHVYYPPMDFLRYWVKTINGVYEDPKEMNR